MSTAAIALLGQLEGASVASWIVAIISVVAAVAVLLVFAQLFSLWLQAYASQAGVTFVDLIGMRLRRSDCRTLLLGKIMLTKAGIHEVTIQDLERHDLAQGSVPNVANAMIEANRANIDLSWQEACEIDLAGQDILETIGVPDARAVLARSNEV